MTLQYLNLAYSPFCFLRCPLSLLFLTFSPVFVRFLVRAAAMQRGAGTLDERANRSQQMQWRLVISSCCLPLWNCSRFSPIQCSYARTAYSKWNRNKGRKSDETTCARKNEKEESQKYSNLLCENEAIEISNPGGWTSNEVITTKLPLLFERSLPLLWSLKLIFLRPYKLVASKFD